MTPEIVAGPDGSSGPVVARHSQVLGSNPGRVGCLSYTGIQNVQRPGVYIVVYGTVYHKKPLKLFNKSAT